MGIKNPTLEQEINQPIDKDHLRYAKEILLHKNSKTTEIYTHVSKASLVNIRNPLDSIKEKEL